MDIDLIVGEITKQVRGVVGEADERAAEIVREAEREAQRIRAEAEADARRQLDEVQRALSRLESDIGGGAEPRRGVERASVTVSESAPEPVREQETQAAFEKFSGAEGSRRRFGGVVRELFQRGSEAEPVPERSRGASEPEPVPVASPEAEEPNKRRREPSRPSGDHELRPPAGDRPTTDELIDRLKSWTE